MLSGTSTYTGTTTIQQGFVRPVVSGAFGASTGGAVTIQSGAALDLNLGAATAINFGQKEFIVSGQGVDLGGGVMSGVLTNSSANSQLNAFQRVTLAGNSTFNTNASGRFDIRGSQVAGVNTAKLDLAGFTLKKTGAAFFGIVNADVTAGNSKRMAFSNWKVLRTC